MPSPDLALAPHVRRGAIVLVANTLWYLWTFRRATIERLIACGFDVICVGKPCDKLVRLRGLGCIVAPLQWRLDSLDPLHELKIVAELHRIIGKHQPHVVFSFTIKANLNASLACRLSGVPYVTNVSGLGTAFLRDDLKYKLVRRLFGFANSAAHTVFFQNRSDLALFQARGLSTGARHDVLPGSGIDTDHFAYAPPPEKVRTFVLIARLIRDKGVIEYLEAARELRAEDSRFRFLLVGPANVENAGAIHVDQIEAYHDAVEYLGEVDDVRPILREADCLVLPSYREGMPKVVLEAASTGRLAIVADSPGCRDAIEPELTGFLCKVRSAQDLALAMRRAAGLGAAEIASMTAAARERIVREFHIDRSTAPYLAIANELQR